MISETNALSIKAPSASDLIFIVPEDDTNQAAFNALPSAVRDDVDRALLAIEEIHAAPKTNPKIKELAHSFGSRRGFNFNSLRAKYYWYTSTGKPDQYGNILFAAGDWRCLVDWSRVPVDRRPGAEAGRGDRVALPPDFVEFFKGLCGSNQKKSEPAIRKLYALWRAGESISGYGTWQEWFQAEHPHMPLPEHCPPDLPRGWSKSNLRDLIPEKAELALTRRGKAEALRCLPDILTTRDGLRPLEYIEFDDFRTDFKILVPGYASPVELNGLVAIDVATGFPLRFGLRPAIKREDGMADKLKLRDMKALIAGILADYGVPTGYLMNLVVENATATVRDGFAAALRELSCGQIVVHKTEIICGTSIWAGYKNKAGGNPQGKPHVESTFNLFHNEAAFVKGQIGRRYDEGPSELAGRTAEAEALAKTDRYLTPHQRARLKRPFLNYAQARLVVGDIWNLIARRDDHQMEGFEVVGEWRQEQFQQWRPEHELSLLPADQQALVIWRNPARKESPFERRARLYEAVGGQSAFRRLHRGTIARLYDEHLPKTIEQFQISFRLDKETYIYRIANRQFSKVELKNGMNVLCYYDAQDPSWIHLTDKDGGYLGSIPRTLGIRKTDKEALKADYARKQAEFNALRDKVSARLPEQTEERIADIAANSEVLAEALDNANALETGAAIDEAVPVEDAPSTINSQPSTTAAAIGAAKTRLAVARRQTAAKEKNTQNLANIAEQALLAGKRT